jgi:hypothetical protein
MTPNYESLAEWQKAIVRKLYEDSPEVLANLHRVIVQVGQHTGIVQSVVAPWLMEEAQISYFGPQEPPQDYRIFNRRQPDGTFRPLSEFFDTTK